MKKILLFTIFQMGLLVLFAQQRTQIIIHAPVLSPEDSLELFVQPQRIGYYTNSPSSIVLAENKGGVFNFSVSDLDKPNWVSLSISYQKKMSTSFYTIFKEFLIEPEDSVVVNLKPKSAVFSPSGDGYISKIPILLEAWDASFSGRGLEKFEAQWRLQKLNGSDHRKKFLADAHEVNQLSTLEMLDSIERESFKLIESYKGKITEDVAVLLLAQQKGALRYEMGRVFESIIHPQKDKEYEEGFVLLKEKFLALGKEDLQSASDLEAKSPKFIDYLTKYSWVAFLDQYEPGGAVVKGWYELVKKLSGPSLVRDRVMSSLLFERFQYQPQRELLDEVLSCIQDPFALNQASLLKSLLEGEQGYAFSLPDASGKYHKAEHYKGKVVFMDFWYAACGPCKKYMKDVVRPIKLLYKDNPNVVFITVSTDGLELFKSMLRQDGFLPEGGVHLYTDGQGFKHPIIKHYQIQSYPYPLLIGKDGKLLTGKFNLSKSEGLKQGIDWALGH